MPYKHEWVEAELAIEHKGVRVYHAYKEDDYETPFEFWFVSDADAMFHESWDVRDLRTSNPKTMSPIAMLKAGIEAGLITQEGVRDPK